MDNSWIDDYERVSANALSADWFVSPLEYFWPDGKKLNDAMFRAPSSPHEAFDAMVSPDLFKASMQVDFRSKMMVLAYMRQGISKSYGVEIENGLLHLCRLDFLSCLTQWVYVIEGYCRQIFSVSSCKNVKSKDWVIPTSPDPQLNKLLQVLSSRLSKYLDGVMFRSESDPHVERLSRHLLLHGNAKNKDIFSQKNCLILLFILDALVVIEMVRNGDFPQVFQEREGEEERIKRRQYVYFKQLEHAFQDDTLLKVSLLREHL